MGGWLIPMLFVATPFLVWIFIGLVVYIILTVTKRK